jgi:hypothetical protein
MNQMSDDGHFLASHLALFDCCCCLKPRVVFVLECGVGSAVLYYIALLIATPLSPRLATCRYANLLCLTVLIGRFLIRLLLFAYSHSPAIMSSSSERRNARPKRKAAEAAIDAIRKSNTTEEADDLLLELDNEGAPTVFSGQIVIGTCTLP